MSNSSVEFTIKLAGMPIKVYAEYESTKDFCKDYLSDEEPLFEVAVTKEDLKEMSERSAETDLTEGRSVVTHGDEYLETLALYRVILDELIKRNVLLFHGSVLAVNGKAYMFTAKSGVGKTTHSKLWLKNFPHCHILNGDKPLILVNDDGIFACGTPWQGKENYGTNEILPLKAVCIVTRSEENSIEKITFSDAFQTLTTQIHHPGDALLLSMRLINKMSGLKFYRLHCNMQDEAAFVSYEKMVNDDEQ